MENGICFKFSILPFGIQMGKKKWNNKILWIYIYIYIYEWLAYIIAMYVFWKVVFEKLLFKLSCVCLLLEKLVNGKHFPVKEKFDFVFKKIFSFYFRQKTLFQNYKKFRNIILFVDYNKFDSQSFDAIYFVLNLFFFNFTP